MNSFKCTIRPTVFSVLASGIAVAVAISSSPASPGDLTQGGKSKAFRKTTDPPVPAEGKLGQDLFLAIDHRDVATVTSLLKKGADPNSRNGLQFLPLYVAAASHQNDVVKALLAAGAKADGESPYGTPLTFAAITANLEAAQLLFPKNVNVNHARADGTTVLMMSAFSGRPDFVVELLKRKAAVNAKNMSGATALSYAARSGNVMAGSLLVDAGANVNSQDNYGQTPLMVACLAGSSEFVKMLLDKDAKPNLRDAKRRTALMLAVSHGDNADVVRALLDHGADTQARDLHNRTAATIAGSKGFVESAKLLGVQDAKVDQRRNPRQAVALSLKLLEYSMREFTRNAGCISCHQEGLGRIVTASARDHGFTTDSALEKDQIARIRGALKELQPLHAKALTSAEAMKQVPLIEMNEVNPGDSWLLAGMAAQHDAPNAGTAAMAMVLARQQMPDGFWSFSLPRVPMQSSVFTFTALAIKSLNAYAPRANAAEVKERIGKAKAWLMKAPAQSSDDRAFRLLGLKWCGASLDERRASVDELIASQRPDGGWSQMPNMQSDAYATGQALYALRVGGGIAPDDPSFAKGIEYLLRTQDDDGSWFVNKRAIPANNYFDAGFPGGESQYASFNGTCWAVLALLETVPRQN
jgi:ankyrin repeat protein